MDDDFHKKMAEIFIPALSQMIKAEKKHLSMLKEKGASKKAIETSQKWLAHYSKRFIQYKMYVKDEVEKG